MWRLEFSARAEKQLSKMEPATRRIILVWLLKNLDGCEDPRVHGKGLTAGLSRTWRYRVGDYRILAEIRDRDLVVLAIEIGHRSVTYR